jgi:hypothetical protein
MVIKSAFVHSGWSYGKGDDQYDNESIGSTKTVVKLEKSMENSSSNKKNEYDTKICRAGSRSIRLSENMSRRCAIVQIAKFIKN